MFCLMLLLFGAVVFISGTDPKKLKDFINKLALTKTVHFLNTFGNVICIT